MKWLQSLNQKLLKPQIAHSLKGRVRIELPLLKHLPKDALPDAQQLQSLTNLLPNVQSITLSSQTVLITYDADTLQEEQIFQALEAISRFIIEKRTIFEAMTENEFLAFLENLEAYSIKNGVYSFFINHEIKIPHEIFPAK